MRVRSTQKLPISRCSHAKKPRMIAAQTAMPAAAETKFCTVSPTIWLKYDIVVSPP